jgi:cobalt transporter subunit CbtB
MQYQATTADKSQSLTLSKTVQVMSAIALGAALFFVVGFAPMDVAHNAAHDARHAFAFPCH